MHTFTHDTEMQTFTCNCGNAIAIERDEPQSMAVALRNEGWRYGCCPDCADRTIGVDRVRDRLDRQWQTQEALEGRR